MIPLNEDTREILGRPNFACTKYAEILRLGGTNIPRKAEEEQAAVIYWLLCVYEEFPNTWRIEAVNQLQRIVAAEIEHQEGRANAKAD